MAAGGVFQKQNNLQSRYALLLRPGALTPVDSDEEDRPGRSQEYAAFLRYSNCIHNYINIVQKNCVVSV